jgi:hypothetical protein
MAQHGNLKVKQRMPALVFVNVSNCFGSQMEIIGEEKVMPAYRFVGIGRCGSAKQVSSADNQIS